MFEWDAETGLLYFRARYYSPNAGRFLQNDPSSGMLLKPGTVVSRYLYAGNNPALRTDPTGKSYIFNTGNGGFTSAGGDQDLFDVHGYYCGPDAHGQSRYPFNPDSDQKLPPQDDLDASCASHDAAYANWSDFTATNESLNRWSADIALGYQGIRYIGTQPMTGLEVAVAAGLFLALDTSILTPNDILQSIGNLLGIHFTL